jgi:hypothetical protein
MPSPKLKTKKKGEIKEKGIVAKIKTKQNIEHTKRQLHRS